MRYNKSVKIQVFLWFPLVFLWFPTFRKLGLWRTSEAFGCISVAVLSVVECSNYVGEGPRVEPKCSGPPKGLMGKPINALIH